MDESPRKSGTASIRSCSRSRNSIISRPGMACSTATINFDSRIRFKSGIGSSDARHASGQLWPTRSRCAVWVLDHLCWLWNCAIDALESPRSRPSTVAKRSKKGACVHRERCRGRADGTPEPFQWSVLVFWKPLWLSDRQPSVANRAAHVRIDVLH